MNLLDTTLYSIEGVRQTHHVLEIAHGISTHATRCHHLHHLTVVRLAIPTHTGKPVGQIKSHAVLCSFCLSWASVHARIPLGLLRIGFGLLSSGGFLKL